jgi:hypothetical protein
MWRSDVGIASLFRQRMKPHARKFQRPCARLPRNALRAASFGARRETLCTTGHVAGREAHCAA